MLLEKILSGEIDTENRVNNKLRKYAEVLGIDITDEKKMMMLFSIMQKQHSTTKKNIVRLLKNKVENFPQPILDEIEKLSIVQYVSLNVDYYNLRDKLEKYQRTLKKSYIRHGVVGLDDVHKHVGVTDKLTFDDITVNITAPRFELYKKNTTCTHCGIVGSFYAIESTKKSNPFDWHLNLYGYVKHGGNSYEVMITQDHIIPKSKGGPTHVNNLQALCTFCNKKKDLTNDDIFKNGIKEVTFFNVNEYAKKCGIRLEKDDNCFFFSGSDSNPNLMIYELTDRKFYINNITDYSWKTWIEKIDEICLKLIKIRKKR